MTLSNRNDISIVELVFYTPALLFSVFLCVRHGFGPNKGWLFLLIFGLIRLVGASLELATIGFPASIPSQTSAALLSSVGLSPLMFTTLGLLFRVCKNINKNHCTVIQTIHIHLLRIPIIVALVLVIIGSDTSAGDLIHHGTYSIQRITKIGIIILVAIFAVIVLITALFVYRRSYAESGERRLIKAIATSLLFLLVRLVYVVLIYFSHIRTFSILYGSIVALGCMAILQEMLVVIIYIGVGLTLPRKTKEPRVQTESRWSRGRMRVAGGFQRFIKFLERPKVFFRRLMGPDTEVSRDKGVFNDLHGEKWQGKWFH